MLHRDPAAEVKISTTAPKTTLSYYVFYITWGRIASVL